MTCMAPMNKLKTATLFAFALPRSIKLFKNSAAPDSNKPASPMMYAAIKK